MPIALKAPAVFGADLDLRKILTACDDVGVDTIELTASTVEAFLDKPTVPAWWLQMPENGFETGALPLEEEILQDEIDLARQSFGGRVREWRAAVSFAPLEEICNAFDDAGLSIATLNWTDLSELSDLEVDWAFNLAKALGARALSTPLVGGGPRRLALFTDRHAMRIGFYGDATTRPGDFEAALSHSTRHSVSLDLHLWAASGHGSPLPFLRQHIDRVIQVYVDAADLRDGPGAEIAGEVLQEIAANSWPLQVTIGLEDQTCRGADRIAAIEHAIAYCLNGLRLST